jgi:5-dehydro-4-deoxyglucarate dehydratase
MDPRDFRSALRGVLAFSPTLLREDGSVDLDSFGTHVEHLSRHDVGAVVVSGGVGEFYALRLPEYTDLVRVAVDAVGGRVPVVAGVGHSTDIATGFAAAAAGCGVAGIMVNPLYFIRPDITGLARHYAEISAAAGGLGLIVFSTPAYVYDETALDALSAVDAVVAVKDEVGDLELLDRCVARFGDRFEWINGMAEVPALEYARRGATSMTSGLVNLDPQVSIDVWRAATAGDAGVLDTLLQTRVRPLADLRTRRPGYHITVIKTGIALLGHGGATVRLPLTPMLDADRDELAETLSASGYRPYAQARPAPATS